MQLSRSSNGAIQGDYTPITSTEFFKKLRKITNSKKNFFQGNIFKSLTCSNYTNSRKNFDDNLLTSVLLACNAPPVLRNFDNS